MKKQGFTLIEVLISCAILSISFAISLNLINASNKAFLFAREKFSLNQKLINHKHLLLSLPYSSKELKEGIHKLNIKKISLSWEVKNKGQIKHIHLKIKERLLTANLSFIKTPK